MQIDISKLRLDGGTQPRQVEEIETINDYAEAMKNGAAFPAVTVFFDGTDYWLADGFHRTKAHIQLGRSEIECDLHEGTQRDAILHSVGANAVHGLRRKNIDKRRAVMTLLNDDEWAQWSDRKIADTCGVGNKFVSMLRLSLFPEHSDRRTYTTKHGTTATMRTANIGSRAASIIKPALSDTTPAAITDAVDSGDISLSTAIELAAEIEVAPEPVQEMAIANLPKHPEVIPIITALYENKRETFDVMQATGTLDGEIPLSDVTPRDIERHLEQAAEEHRRQAIEEKKQREQQQRDEAIKTATLTVLETVQRDTFKHGDIVCIGDHFFICDDNRSDYVRGLLKGWPTSAMAFCDIPYNAGVADWDKGDFVWQHDFLTDHATLVAVTPGIGNLWNFMSQTQMPYKWSLSTHISNGMTRGAVGFGNWIYTALFSSESVFRQKQDIHTVSINSSDAHDLGAKRQKPPQYLAWLFQLFTDERDTIIDPFAGSGTTALVAHGLNRRSINIEIDPDTFAGMVARVSDTLKQSVRYEEAA